MEIAMTYRIFIDGIYSRRVWHGTLTIACTMIYMSNNKVYID